MEFHRARVMGRDGLMTGQVRRTGLSARLIRTSIEISVLAIGFAPGGIVGPGTVAYALAVGPLVQVFLPYFRVRPWESGSKATPASGGDHRMRACAGLS